VTPKKSQAQVLISKFGGARNLMRALKRIGKARNASTVYRWTYPTAKGGTGGVIPAESLVDVLAAARMEGVFITPQELDPRGEM